MTVSPSYVHGLLGWIVMNFSVTRISILHFDLKSRRIVNENVKIYEKDNRFVLNVKMLAGLLMIARSVFLC